MCIIQERIIFYIFETIQLLARKREGVREERRETRRETYKIVNGTFGSNIFHFLC